MGRSQGSSSVAAGEEHHGSITGLFLSCSRRGALWHRGSSRFKGCCFMRLCCREAAQRLHEFSRLLHLPVCSNPPWSVQALARSPCIVSSFNSP
eukprot:1797641-Lingulodinium_polyedra.AAC.1